MSPTAEPTASRQGQRGEKKRGLLFLAGPLALAGAMVVYVVAQRGPSGPELPAYAVSVVSEGAPTPARLRVAHGKGARFELALRPAAAPEGRVVAYPFTVTQPGAEPAPLDAQVTLSPDGLVRLTGSSRSLEGAGEVRIVIGAPTDIGKFDDATARAKSTSTGPRVRVLVVPIDRD